MPQHAQDAAAPADTAARLRAVTASPAAVPLAFAASVLVSSLAGSKTPLAHQALTLVCIGALAAPVLAAHVRPGAPPPHGAAFLIPPVAISAAAFLLGHGSEQADALAHCPLVWLAALHAARVSLFHVRDARVQDPLTQTDTPRATRARNQLALLLATFLGTVAARPATSPQALKGVLVLGYTCYAAGYELALARHRRRAPRTGQTGRLSVDDACAYLARVHRLTLRESEVLPLLARGHDMALVAQELGMGASTARVHAHSIHAKLGTAGAGELAALVGRTQQGVTHAQMDAAQASPALRGRGRPRKLEPTR